MGLSAGGVQKGKELFITFVIEVSLYTREAEPQI